MAISNALFTSVVSLPDEKVSSLFETKTVADQAQENDTLEQDVHEPEEKTPASTDIIPYPQKNIELSYQWLKPKMFSLAKLLRRIPGAGLHPSLSEMDEGFELKNDSLLGKITPEIKDCAELLLTHYFDEFSHIIIKKQKIKYFETEKTAAPSCILLATAEDKTIGQKICYVAVSSPYQNRKLIKHLQTMCEFLNQANLAHSFLVIPSLSESLLNLINESTTYVYETTELRNHNNHRRCAEASMMSEIAKAKSIKGDKLVVTAMLACKLFAYPINKDPDKQPQWVESARFNSLAVWATSKYYIAIKNMCEHCVRDKPSYLALYQLMMDSKSAPLSPRRAYPLAMKSDVDETILQQTSILEFNEAFELRKSRHKRSRPKKPHPIQFKFRLEVEEANVTPRIEEKMETVPNVPPKTEDTAEVTTPTPAITSLSSSSVLKRMKSQNRVPRVSKVTQHRESKPFSHSEDKYSDAAPTQQKEKSDAATQTPMSFDEKSKPSTVVNITVNIHLSSSSRNKQKYLVPKANVVLGTALLKLKKLQSFKFKPKNIHHIVSQLTLLLNKYSFNEEQCGQLYKEIGHFLIVNKPSGIFRCCCSTTLELDHHALENSLDLLYSKRRSRP